MIAGRHPETNGPRRDKSRLASTEVPGRGEFYLYHDIDRSRSGDWGGAVWIIKPEAADLLAKAGFEALFLDDTTRDAAALCLVAQEKEPDNAGLVIDFYNNPSFDRENDIGQDSEYQAAGIIDVLAMSDARDPLVSVIREMLRGLLNALVREVKTSSDHDTLSILCVFFHNVQKPQAVTEKIFADYAHVVTKSAPSVAGSVTIEVILPLEQF